MRCRRRRRRSAAAAAALLPSPLPSPSCPPPALTAALTILPSSPAALRYSVSFTQVPPDAAARGSDAVAAIAQKKAKVAEAQACGGVGIRYHRCWVCGNTTATHGMVQNRCGRWFCFACRSALNKLEKWEGPGKGKGQGVIGGGK